MALVGMSNRRQRKATAKGSAAIVRPWPVFCQALDQSSRYADLSLTEEVLIKNGKYVFVAYIMEPMAGYEHLAAAAHFKFWKDVGCSESAWVPVVRQASAHWH